MTCSGESKSLGFLGLACFSIQRARSFSSVSFCLTAFWYSFWSRFIVVTTSSMIVAMSLGARLARFLSSGVGLSESLIFFLAESRASRMTLKKVAANCGI